MRITFRVSTAGRSGFMRLPLLAAPADSYFTDDVLDEARVRGELGRLDCVQFSGDDDRGVMVVVIDILDRVKAALDGLAGLDRVRKDDAATPSEERMDRGRFATVRLDVSRRADGYRIALRVSSPNDVPGRGALRFAETFAQAVADNVVAVRDDTAADRREGDPGIRFTLVEGEGCEGVFGRAEKRNAHALLAREYRAKYGACERRHDCRTREGLKLCSPCRFDCPCFRDGGTCGYEDIVNGKRLE